VFVRSRHDFLRLQNKLDPVATLGKQNA
jgi:hypothetical protein